MTAPAVVRSGEETQTASVGVSERWWVAVVAVLAALPSILWAVWGAGYLTDDWSVWLVFERQGVVDGLHQLAFEQPARPVAAPYYALLYQVIGHQPVVHALLLAAINAGVLVSMWFAGRTFVPHAILWPALFVFAAFPNRATTRLWFVVGTYPLALALMLIGVGLLARRRPAWAALLLLVVATLLYEGVVVLAVLVVAAWTLADLPGRMRTGSLVVIPTAAVAAASFLMSPKRTARGPAPLENASTFLPGQLGVGLWDHALVAQILGGTVLILMAAALVKVLLPSFRSGRHEWRWMLFGGLLTVASAAPFFVSGSIFGTTGVFDRNNLVPSVGTALVLGSFWSLAKHWRPTVAAVLAAGVLSSFTVANMRDVAKFNLAVGRGEQIANALREAAPDGVPDRLVVVPAQRDDGHGVADFIYDGDIQGAMRQRYGGSWEGLVLVENTSCRELGEDFLPVRVFDWEREEIELVPATALDERCASWADDRSAR